MIKIIYQNSEVYSHLNGDIKVVSTEIWSRDTHYRWRLCWSIQLGNAVRTGLNEFKVQLEEQMHQWIPEHSTVNRRMYWSGAGQEVDEKNSEIVAVTYRKFRDGQEGVYVERTKR